ncbi:MAG: DUF3501 family protein [Alphaproteobacteria bacterium]
MPKADHIITADDILSLDDYIPVRKEKRSALVTMKKPRRLHLGPHATAYFENWDTMWAQIQEMLYIEKGGDEQLKDELAAYNPLIPQGRDLVCTFMFEIDEPARRLNILRQLGGIENHIFLQVGDDKIYARPEEDVERTTPDGKTSSVHFFHFDFTDDQIATFRDPSTQVMLGADHENYAHLALLSDDGRQSLAGDFS